MSTILSLVALVAAILQIILFFKIWGMTNDIRYLKEIITKKAEIENIQKKNSVNQQNNIIPEIGTWVILPSGKEAIIKSVEGGKYSCYSNRGLFYEGEYEVGELKISE